MKRKLFSAILFGALLTASTSGLTSCKDYDDDIQNLQSQIDKLATAEQLSAKVTELQGQIEKAKADAVSAADAAKKVGEAAQKSADDAASAAAAAKKAAEDIAASAATKDELKAAADAAQKAVEAIQSEVAGKTSPEDVKAAIDAALTDVLAEVEEHHNAILELDEELNGEGGIAERLAAAEKAIEEGAAEVDLAPIKQLIEDFEKKAQEILGTAFKMVTSVSLYTNTGAGSYLNLPDTDLKFWNVKELEDITYPDNGETGEDVFKFTKDNLRLFDDELLVRVSPTDAVITPEMVSLINSQGVEVSKDIVKIESVEPYNQLLTKSTSNNGLWTVKFKVEDNKKDEFDAIAKVKVNNDWKKVLFAVAINNTAEEADTRRVISSYDVTMDSSTPVPATMAGLEINGKSIGDIHNRITQTEQGQSIPSDVAYDLIWKNDPAVTPVYISWDNNASNAKTGDNRQGKNVLVVEVNQEIKIDFKKNNRPIRGFYVTTDYKRAVESGNSEINAWNGYKYENVGTFKSDGTQLVAAKLQEGNTGYIKVLDLADMALVGDVIGFRIFAINLDGTLVDPDGIAFYVGIGAESSADSKELPAAEATIKYAAAGSSSRPLTVGDKDHNTTDLIDATSVMGVDYDNIVWSCSMQRANTSFAISPSYGTDFEILYLQSDNRTYSTTTPSKKFKVQLIQPTQFEDDATSTITAKLYKSITGGGQYLVRTITMPLKKAMPTEVPENVIYNALQNKYLLLNAATWNNVSLDSNGKNTNAVNGTFDLTKFLVYADANNTKIGSIADAANYTYLLSNSEQNPYDSYKYTAEMPVATPFNATTIDKSLINCKDEHSIRAKFVYKNISKVWDSNTNNWKASNDLELYAAQDPTVVYCTWSYQAADFTTFAATRLRKGAGTSASPFEYIYKSYIVWTDKDDPVTDCSGLINIKAKYGFKAQFATNTFDNNSGDASATIDNLYGLVTNGYLKIADAWTEANGVKNAYFEPQVAGGTITSITQVAEPAPDHEEVFVIKVVDCFNYSSEIRVPVNIVTTRPNYSEYTKDVTFE